MRLWALFLLLMPISGWCQADDTDEEVNEEAKVCFKKIRDQEQDAEELCIEDKWKECFQKMTIKIVGEALTDKNITIAPTTTHGIQVKNQEDRRNRGDKVDVEVARGECDKMCIREGEAAFRKIRYIKCQENSTSESDIRICDKEIYTENEECVDLAECKPDENFGPWSCWSKCSRTCVVRADEPSMRIRSRVCQPGVPKTECAGQLVESEECSHIPACTDKVICPAYAITDIKSEGSMVRATINMDLVVLSFGNLIEQKVVLGNGIEHTWGKDEINKIRNETGIASTVSINKQTNETGIRLTHTFKNLRIGNTYFPKLQYKSTLVIKNGDTFSEGGLNLTCQGKEFSTNEWTCPNDRKTISSSNVCDSKADCPTPYGNGIYPDEDPKLCQGEYMEYVIPGVGIYVFLGIVAYIGTRRLGITSKKPSGEERSLNTFGQMEENNYEEVEIDERAEHFSSNLITIFTTKRTWNNNDLTDDEKKVIEDEYLKLKQNGKIHFAYEHLKASADAPTVEVVMKFLLLLEKKNNQFTNEKPVYLYIMEKIPSDNPELKEWIFNNFEQGISYQLKKYAKMGFPCLVGPVAFIAHYAVPIASNLYIIFSSYFELFKDIIFFMVIRHFDQDILQHQYDEVGGINLQFVSWYILAVACGSYIAIGIHHFTSKNTMKVYLKQTNSPYFFRVMTAFFPVHFASFESIRLGIEKEARNKEIKQFYATFQARQDQVDVRVLAKEYSELYNKVKATTDDTVSMIKVQNSVRTWETVIEHVPTAITVLCLLIVSVKFQRIRVFMETNFQKLVAKDQFEIIFAIIALMTLTSIVTTVTSIRNAKRLPLKPTLIGTITQPLMIMVLLSPKVFLASMAFASMPYCFPIALLLEYLIIVGYNKANFGSFHWFSASTLATLCTPALYSIPGAEKDRTGTKSLEADRDKPMLEKYGKFGHTIVLYILTGLVYLSGFFLLKEVADEKVNVLADSFKGFTFDQVFNLVLGSYFGAPLVYGALLYIYYRFGHNYSVFISNKNAMHGEMNAFAENANMVECDLYQAQDMKPTMPSKSSKPQNVYA